MAHICPKNEWLSSCYQSDAGATWCPRVLSCMDFQKLWAITLITTFQFFSAVLSPIVFLKAWSKGQHRTPKNAFEAAKTMDNPCPSLPYFTGHWLLIFLIGVGGGRQLKSCDTFLGWFSIQPLLQAPRLHWIHLNSRYKTREESELKCQGSTSSDSSTKGFSKFFER